MDYRKMDNITQSLAEATTRRQALKLFGGGALGVAALALGANRTDAAPKTTGAVPIPVTGTIPEVDGLFEGVFTLTQFITQGGGLLGVGTLTGTLTGALGDVLGTVTDLPIQLPLTLIDGACDILHLELGPLDLDLLGLVVHLDKVVLDITAQPGGGLLGDLLCSIAGLLEGNGNALGLLRNLLNQVLSLITP
jgi:hypothetical protein